MKTIVLISSDNNSLYRDFYPICRKFWRHIGFIPVHLQIGDENFPLIAGISSSLQAQIVRLYASKFYPNSIVITSDIDMLPLNKNYFTERLPKNEEEIVVFTSNTISNDNNERYAMCYISTYGKTLSDIVLSNKNETWYEFVHRLNDMNLGWDTDEIFITKQIKGSKYKSILHKRPLDTNDKTLFADRLSRRNWNIEKKVYMDAHCPRPYEEHRSEIDHLFKLIKP